MQNVLTDCVGEVPAAIFFLEKLISTSAQHREIVAKHIQSVLMTNHVEPLSSKKLMIVTIIV